MPGDLAEPKRRKLKERFSHHAYELSEQENISFFFLFFLEKSCMHMVTTYTAVHGECV